MISPSIESYAAKRDHGIQVSSDNSGEKWKKYALGFVKRHLTKHKELFVDDLWECGLKEPVSPRALGAVLKIAAKKGWMKRRTFAGCVLAMPSDRSNGQLKAVWKSNIYKPSSR